MQRQENDLTRPSVRRYQRRWPLAAVAVSVILALGVTGCAGTQKASGGGPSSSATAAGRPSQQPKAGTPAASKSAAAPASSTAGSSTPKAPSSPAKKPVPQPTPGDIHHTIKANKQQTKDPVSLEQQAKVTNLISAEITSLDPIAKVQAKLPGEISGPAVALSLLIKNGSDAPISLDNVVINVTDSHGGPRDQISTSPAKPLTGRLDAGKSAEGVYVFTVPVKRRDPITVSVTLSAAEPVVLFEGKVR